MRVSFMNHFFIYYGDSLNFTQPAGRNLTAADVGTSRKGWRQRQSVETRAKMSVPSTLPPSVRLLHLSG